MNTHSLRTVLGALADGRDVDASALQWLRSESPELSPLVDQVVDRVTRLRRRDLQFAAVVALTHDLVARRDGALLDSIVGRAHELLGSDVTYISVYDKDAETFKVCAVQGETNPDFRGMIVPPGVGIASRVVQKMGPVWVDDYPKSFDLPHDCEIDRIVGSERISSILGVPLLVESEVLGVLFVADRRSRQYSPEEISLASSFADHAAIVIEQDRLVEDLHSASLLAERERRRAEISAAEVSQGAALHEQLISLVASGANPPTIAAALEDSLGRRIAVIDADFTVLAGPDDLVPADEGLLAPLRGAFDKGSSVVLDEGPAELIAPIVAQQTPVAAVLVEHGRAPLTRAERRSVERSGVAFALVWMQRRASDLAEERIRGELVKELVDAHGDQQQVLERVRVRGLNPARPWRVAHFLVDPVGTERILRSLRSEKKFLAASNGGRVWAFTPEPGLVERIERAARAANIGELLIVEQEASTLGALLDELDSIRGARDFVSAMGQTSGVVRADAFAPYAVLFDGRGERAEVFVESTLRPLLEWDAKRGTELFTTLMASLDEQGSITAIARRLAVHPNTVRQRLERIGGLLPVEWHEPDARFRLEMAARMEAARRSIHT
ncbi:MULTISPECIES: helix-turn-helix domain-containing protein [Brachybacterium]|uniref:GAF domain-containing protein n=2 Tax=Brachybacterium TaxID=43668 RepID=A0A426SN04_9MICO|nr:MULTISPECIES: GAF domain-containing protein [Brachybacterium]MCT1437598.1 GAF domain-containing protein [Brachybacterium paraconglomeratum]RRR19650.1 hypothetical protein DS079_05230 [Brachybacterium paraconglomeratum]GLI31325.1 hypothetical protein BCONGLO52_21660 [Brachybacterium conglomeratum]